MNDNLQDDLDFAMTICSIMEQCVICGDFDPTATYRDEFERNMCNQCYESLLNQLP